ncbi:MAG: NAD(P)/FAD-dependent oxidoreductase [Gemmobacter sp.]|nr:NAD(P)/FAD-dependent oxidoreductase [Gemmobacter sp.]
MTAPDPAHPVSLDIAIVGAGFAGLYALHKLRKHGYRVHVFDAGDDIGGTWYWNRYPGARCDIESMQYSYSWDEQLQQDWQWTERFATQPEILRYIHHVADRFDLSRDITLNTRITAAIFDEAANTWTLTTDAGVRIVAPYAIMATGVLSAPLVPNLAGLDDFKGAIYHTANWPKDGVDFAGLRVGVFGTGSSAIQAIPEIAKQARHLHVFQRTPNFSVPARNQPLTPDTIAQWKSNYPELRRYAREDTGSGTIYDFPTRSAKDVDEATRNAEFEARWAKGGANFMHAYNDLVIDEESNRFAADFVRRKIRETVKDPALADALCPTDYPIFAKRICVDSDYYDTFNRPNVTLVNLKKTPFDRVTETGLRTSASDIALDALVLATGFDAMTGALTRIDIRGIGGQSLKDKWSEGPRAYLGVMSAGFPNLFMVTGPGSPSVLSNVIVSIEQHVDWITDCLLHLRSIGAQRIEPTTGVENSWVRHVNDVASATLLPKAASWYMGANIPGKARVFMPYIGLANFRRKCNEVAANGYEGFRIGQSN